MNMIKERVGIYWRLMNMKIFELLNTYTIILMKTVDIPVLYYI